MVLFRQIGDLGKLYLEKILFEFEKIPMVFVCVDDNKDRYLCLCTDCMDEYSWLICRVDIGVLLKLIKNDITILKSFELSKEKIYLVRKTDKLYLATKYSYIDIPEEELPDENEKLDNPYLQDYILNLEAEEKLSCLKHISIEETGDHSWICKENNWADKENRIYTYTWQFKEQGKSFINMKFGKSKKNKDIEVDDINYINNGLFDEIKEYSELDTIREKSMSKAICMG